MSSTPGPANDPTPPTPLIRGQFLVAGKQMRDPNFYRSVVLMVEYGESGSMGLVVNRPSNVSVARALSEHFDLPESDQLVYVGGPVEPAALFVLHSAGEFETEESDVVPGIYVGSSPDVFERVIEQVVGGSDDLEFRVFAGCAGWGPGQLEGELEHGDWHILPAVAPEILSGDPYTLWDELVERIHETNRTIPPTPGNPEWN
jgi:putative transcriptional regulator